MRRSSTHGATLVTDDTVPLQFRQGDVLLQAVTSLPKEVKGSSAPCRRTVLALGELTGHAHVLTTEQGLIFEMEAWNDRFVTLSANAVLTHEEHATINVPAGSYRVIRQREYRPRPQRASAARTAWVVE